jgi:hypothetical protein
MGMPNNTKARGRKPDSVSKSGQVRELLKTGMSAADIAEKVGCTPGLVYNIKSTSGQSKKRAPREPGQARATRGPGRPRKNARGGSASAAVAGLDGILAAVRGAERERTQMRAALERIRAVIADALA